MQNDIEQTKSAIKARVSRHPEFSVVPEHSMKMFDHVIEQTEAEALAAYPDDEWGRIQFWKREILSRVSNRLRGIVAVQFHEYVAALMRGDDNDGSADPYGFGDRPYNPNAEQVAQRDAYLASVATFA